MIRDCVARFAPAFIAPGGTTCGLKKMPKVKTNKTAAKRFKLTGTGKLMFEHSRQNHLMMSKKDGGRARRMKMDGLMGPADQRKTKRLLPNGL